jgi:hypothetical protein
MMGKASHIVGGEFELLHINDFSYRLNLVLYFDQLNGQSGAKDPSATVTIYQSFDNKRMLTLTLPLTNESNVSYTQPSCSNGELVTLRLLYTSLLTLDPGLFNHPGGYYVSWERCCRNYNISNIFSLDPTTSSIGYAGQTFYLEFPPVVKNGQPFVDSTPRLFPPLNDYACPNRPYYTDFKGTDDDGDSLVYSITTPLSTRFAVAIPPSTPRPYPLVTWRPPYSVTNIMNGSPDLRISSDGFLTVKPSNQGLFVFAIKVEEYRDHVKIGETRRDFQMLVVDACPIAAPPQIVGLSGADTFDETMNVFIGVDKVDGDRCVKVRVSDPDSESIQDNFQERVRIKAIALNFKKDLTSILPTVVDATLLNGSTIEYTICFPQCPFFYGGTPVIGIVAMDDACSLPLSDTLKISVLVEVPPNAQPRFTSTHPVNATLNEGSQQAWPFSVVDDDGDPLVVSVVTNGFTLANSGMQFNIFNQVPGAANGQLSWDAYCDIYDFTQRTSFQVAIQVEDQDLCLVPNPAKALYNLNVSWDNFNPIIDSDLTSNPAERKVTGLTRRIGESLEFNVTGMDSDNDFLVLSSYGHGSLFGLSGLTVEPSPASAIGTVSSLVQWDIKCESVNLVEKDSFNLQFIVVDNANKCRIYKADTLDVELKVLPPLNQAPVLGLLNNNSEATDLSGGVLSVTLGASIDLVLTGLDGDAIPAKDTLKLEMVDAAGNVVPAGYTFLPVEGTSPISAGFTWKPDCSIFKKGIFENEYRFKFMLKDDHCAREKTDKKDSLELTIIVKDIDGSDAAFQPPNFVSPNGDDKNDYYAMERMISETGELENILPNDNCDSRFEFVHIYNRWGKEVFRSTSRDFKWFPDETSVGVYYYSIKFTKKEYKGSLTVRY